jgi:uncharacterized protein (DUF2336 family)
MKTYPTSLIDEVKIEKMLLAKKVGQFLSTEHPDEDRAAVEDVARQLASDLSVKVRSVLAFELRKCERLVPDLAEKIAKDVEEVAGPFLEVTRAISDKAFLRLIPQLKEYARAVLARRSDLSEIVVHALAKTGAEQSVTSLVRNDNMKLPQRACNTVIDRFGTNIRVMDQFSARNDLSPAVVERIVDKVSSHCREILIGQYAVPGDVAATLTINSKVSVLWEELEGLDDEEVHTFVTELRAERRLNHLLTLEMAERGCDAFLVSALALEASLPLDRVRDILTLEDQPAFVRLMRMANVSKGMAPKFLKLAKERYMSVPEAA